MANSDVIREEVEAGVASAMREAQDEGLVPTLRDRFAMAALTGMLANSQKSNVEHYATTAYLIADLMLKARRDKETDDA